MKKEIVKPKKKLGQHFLIDKNIAKKITDLLYPKSENIIELGPGTGVLTDFLIKKKINLKLVEIDNECVMLLKKKYFNLKDQIINADFLKVNINNIFTNKISLIGNFPYNISSQILFKILENKEDIIEIVGMFQKEVGERIIATKGKKKGILSVLIQTYYNVEYCFTLNEQVFHPPPNVKSAVLRFSRNNRLTLKNEMLFFQIVKSGFNQRRKILKNALKTFDILESEKTNYLLNLRAEELTIEDFINITKNVRKNKN